MKLKVGQIGLNYNEEKARVLNIVTLAELRTSFSEILEDGLISVGDLIGEYAETDEFYIVYVIPYLNVALYPVEPKPGQYWELNVEPFTNLDDNRFFIEG